MAEIEVGRVSALWRYPVKSLAGEALESAGVGWHGFAGDRRWAFVRPGMERSGFPWLTLREAPQLWRYVPYFVDAENVETSQTMVKTPEDSVLDVADPALAARFGAGVGVMRQSNGIFDTMPLSLLTVQSVAALSELAGFPLTPPRFRPNLLLDASSGDPFPEDQWTGSILRIGGLRLRVDGRDKRCMVVNVDPFTCGSDPSVLRAIASARDSRLGVYASVVAPGRISVGDPVFREAPALHDSQS
jgi:uncharacterized protein YcbX